MIQEGTLKNAERIQNPYTRPAVVVRRFSVPLRASQKEKRGRAPLSLLAYPNGFEPLTFRVGV